MKFWAISPLFLQAASQIAWVNNLDRYPGYGGLNNITGQVNITSVSGTSYHFDVALLGGIPNMNHTIHVHSGITCSAASAVGGHFWQPFPAADPWLVPTIPADSNGAVLGGFEIDFGFTDEYFNGHALVIHDYNNTRVACGLIHHSTLGMPQYATAVLSVYPGYNGTLAVTGTVEVYNAGDQVNQIVNFRLKGVENNTMGGIHIHEGFTCATSGAHYWANHSLVDPWTQNYTSNQAGSIAEGSIKVNNGYMLADNRYHAVVVHDSANTRIACGLLDGTRAPTSSPTAAPTNPTTAAPTAAPTTAAPSPATSNETCASTEIKGVFSACKVYDFSGAVCSVACSASLVKLVQAFVDAPYNLTEALACLDTVNAASAWVNGDLPALKSRLDYDQPICNTTAPPTDATSGAAFASVSVFAGLLALLM